MNQSTDILSLAQIKVKKNAVEQRIDRLQKEIEENREELNHYEWMLSRFFSATAKKEAESSKKTMKQMAEEVLRTAQRPMSPVEIYEGIVKLGYEGKKANIYTRLFKWMHDGGTAIVQTRAGQYAHKEVAAKLS